MTAARLERLAELALVGAAMLAGAIVFTWPLAVDPTRTLPGPEDSLLNAWILGWVAERTAHGLAAVWDAPVFFPYRTTLAFGEPLFGIAVPLAPVYWLGGNAVLLHNIAVWVSFIIAGTGGYVLGRDLTGRRAAGVVCAAVAAFIPYRFEHLSHIQVLMGGWLWWLAWSLHEYFERPSLWRALRAAIFFILLGLSSLYWAYVAVVPIVAIVVVEAWRRRGPIAAWLRHGAVAAALCGVVFAPVALTMRSMTTGHSPVASTVDAKSYSADLLDYVSGDAKWTIWGSLLRHRGGGADLFPGLTVMLCATIAIVLALVRTVPVRLRQRDARIWLYAVLLVVGVALSLGPAPAVGGRVLFQNPVFDWLSAIVPGFAQMRSASRFVIIPQLAVSVLGAIGVAAWLAVRQPKRVEAIVTVAIVVALIFLDGLSTPAYLLALSPYSRSGERSTSYWLAQRPGGAILDLPLDGWGDQSYALENQYRTLLHRHPILTGWNRFIPPLPMMLADRDSPLTAVVDHGPEAVQFLRALGVRFIVVRPELFADRKLGDAMCDAYVQASGRAPTRFGAVTIVDLGEVAPVSSSDAVQEIAPGDLRVSATSASADRMIDVVLPANQRISGVRLQLTSRSLNDYPRALTVSLSADDDHFVDVFSGSPLMPLGRALRADPVTPTIELRWPLTDARHIRVMQTGRTTHGWFWSANELHLLTPTR